MSGGLSNPAYFNFTSYIAWKVTARSLPSAELRNQFGAAYGQELLKAVWPQVQQEVIALSASRPWRGSGELSPIPQGDDVAASSAPLSEEATLELVTGLLDRLQEGGYMCGWVVHLEFSPLAVCHVFHFPRYQVVWGSAPGTWPSTWMTEPKLTGSAASQEQSAFGQVMQVLFHVPLYVPSSLHFAADLTRCCALLYADQAPPPCGYRRRRGVARRGGWLLVSVCFVDDRSAAIVMRLPQDHHRRVFLSG